MTQMAMEISLVAAGAESVILIPHLLLQACLEMSGSLSLLSLSLFLSFSVSLSHLILFRIFQATDTSKSFESSSIAHWAYNSAGKFYIYFFTAPSVDADYIKDLLTFTGNDVELKVQYANPALCSSHTCTNGGSLLPEEVCGFDSSDCTDALCCTSSRRSPPARSERKMSSRD